jgi:hypothetical protein
MRLGWALVIAGLVAGCGDPMDPGVGGGGGDPTPKELPDGFVMTGCMAKDDCDDGNPCTTDRCDPATHTCTATLVTCAAETTECTVGTCDPSNGKCKAMPANESMACMTSASEPGQCMTGICSPTPQCTLSWDYLDCSSFSKTTTGTTSGSSALADYACATGLTGPEIAYPFTVTTDRDVTLTLSGTTVDLDLLVLEGANCVGNAKCAASAKTASGNETLTFRALGGVDYVIVVDGKNGAAGSYTLDISCVGGTCKPIKALACNTSVMGNTTGTAATSIISSYACNAATPGPEDVYTVTQTTDTNYKMTLKNLTNDLDLVVTLESGGDCDPTWCKSSNIQTGTTEEVISWTGYSSSTYHVMVDGKTTTGGPYLLEVACPASCSGGGNYVSCSSASDTRRNDDASRSKDVVDSWACAPNTTGNEVVYSFSPSVSGMYTFELSGLTADLDLIVIEGGFSTCDPTVACVTSSTVVGTGTESVTFMADSLKDYWIAVDGKNGAASNYTLKMKSASCPGASCYNSANKLDCTYLEDTRRNDSTTKSKNVVDAWACAPNTTGPEVVYKFDPTTSGSYTVTLDGLSADLDLIVVSHTSAFSCDAAAACVASSQTVGTGNESVTFMADAALTYYIAVDGKNGAVGNYHIKLASTSCGAATCKNGFASLSCTSPTSATSNDASGATSNVNTWSCATGMTGPEFAHYFTPTGAGPFTVEMIGLKQDLDLILIEAPTSSTCSPTAACVASSKNLGNASEKLTFTADPAKRYFIIADGKGGAISKYILAITDGCP